MLRSPFSLARVVRLTGEDAVVHRAEGDQSRRFAGPASADLGSSPRRNFQVFGALHFEAEATKQIPERGDRLVRYYDSYSHRQRRTRAKPQKVGEPGSEKIRTDRSALYARKSTASGARAGPISAWAMLIKRVCQVDPVECPRGGGQAKIISFVERRRADVIERIMPHCGLWERPVHSVFRVKAAAPFSKN